MSMSIKPGDRLWVRIENGFFIDWARPIGKPHLVRVLGVSESIYYLELPSSHQNYFSFRTWTSEVSSEAARQGFHVMAWEETLVKGIRLDLFKLVLVMII